MNFDCLDIQNCLKFDWDDGNITKNESKHNLKWQIIEEIFLNKPLMVVVDIKHSNHECRCNALGFTNENEKLFVAFTKRANQIRVISARPMNKKERKIYANFKNNSNI
jgi:uncharacterized DUF497 family protein